MRHTGPAYSRRVAESATLRALVVDDELPALDQLAYLLRQNRRIGEIRRASSAADALKALEGEDIDVVLSDIKMPGLDGLDLARVLARFTSRPRIVFVTAYDEHAVDAFQLQATDYVMKPVPPARLAEAVRRVVEGSSEAGPTAPEDETIPSSSVP